MLGLRLKRARHLALLKQISVKKDGTGDFTEIQAAINSITDATSSKRYIINVYDDHIVTNMTDLYRTVNGVKNTLANPTEPVSLFTTKNWIIIRGVGAKKTLSVQSPINLTGSSLQYINTIWLAGNCTLKNFNVTVKGGRYAIHQESGGSVNHIDFNATTICEDLYVEHLGNQDHTNGAGWTSVFASANGGCSGLKMIYRNCEWKAPIGPYYTHDNVNFLTPMGMEFYNCKMTRTGVDSSGGTQLDIYPSLAGMGSGVVSTIKIINCDFPNFDITNKGWSGQVITDLTHDFRNGGATISGSGNTEMKIAGIFADVLVIDAEAMNGTLEVVDDRGTNVNSAYGLIFGSVYRYYPGTSDSYASISGTERLQESSNGSRTFSLGARLGDCSVTPKTLTIKVNGTDRVVTFNLNYTATAVATILTSINSQLAGYADVYAGVSNNCFDCYPDEDQYELGFNVGSTSISKYGRALVRDTSKGVGGWRLAQIGDRIEGVSGERMDKWISDRVSYGKVLLKGKVKLGTIFPSVFYNTNVLNKMYKAGANGTYTETTILADADLIGTGYSTLSWL